MPLVTRAGPGWAEKLETLPPGDHVAVLTGTCATGIVGRLAGLELRDAIAVLLPGPGVGLVFLFRKPIVEPTLAAQVLATGTGGLNIGACRVGLTGGTKRSGQAPRDLREDGVQDRSTIGREFRTGHTVVELFGTGRWPPNVLLVHGEGCQRVGTRQVQGNGHWPKARKTGGISTGGHAGQDDLDERHADETVPDWVCEERCPVPRLDALSGDRPSTMTGRADPSVAHAHPSDAESPHQLYGKGMGAAGTRVYADSGGASRFYPQFESLDDLQAWLANLVGTPDPALVV